MRVATRAVREPLGKPPREFGFLRSLDILRTMKTKVALALLLSLFLGIRAAWGCSCIELTLEQKLRHSSVVFVGTLIGKSEKNGRAFFEFSVSEAFKGKLGDEIVVASFPKTSDCASYFAAGVNYLVYASGPQDSLFTGQCSGNLPLNKAEGKRELEELRAMQGKTP